MRKEGAGTAKRLGHLAQPNAGPVPSFLMSGTSNDGSRPESVIHVLALNFGVCAALMIPNKVMTPPRLVGIAAAIAS